MVDFLRNSPASGIDQFFINGQITAVYTIADQVTVRLSLTPDIRPVAKTRISVTPAMLAAFGVTAEQTFRRRLSQDVQHHGALTKQQFAVIYDQVSVAGFATRGAVRRLVTWMVMRFPRHDRPDWMTRSLAASRNMPEDVRVARPLNDDPERDSDAG